MKPLFFACFMFASASISLAQDSPLWMRYPALSPDGKTIAFCYKGDIYRVDAAGGTASPITIHEAHDMMPVWSRDGKQIAFASNRHGNFDVFVMPSTGGAPTRLTFHHANDFPYDFGSDNTEVLFGSARQTTKENVRFYSPRLFQNLYSVKSNGGRAKLLSVAGVENARMNAAGTQIVFQDRKGYEDPWRKHQTSSVTRDLVLWDIKSNKYQTLTPKNIEDREPMWSADDKELYFLSEKNGNQNVFKRVMAGGAETQLTQFKDHPVRHLSVSKSNTLCFSQNGEIYTMASGGKPERVNIKIYNDGRQGVEKSVSITGDVGEFSLSPNGKEIAFINRGEVFVTGVDGGGTKRVTNTPEQERYVNWSPDSKSIIYAAERGESWDIYKSTIVRKEEPYFFAATLLKEELVVGTKAEEFMPAYSPDGKEIAFVEERNILRVYNIASKQTRTLLPEGHNYSYADGDWGFTWSPDSKYIMCNDQQGSWTKENARIIPVDLKSEGFLPVNSGYSEGNAKYAMDGKLMLWTSSREGRKSMAYQGSREQDVFGVFFNQEAYDRFRLSKEEFALLKEKEEADKKEADKKEGDKKKDIKADSTKKDTIAPWTPDFKNLDNRRVKLTINSSSISDYALTSDGSKLYYLASFEKGYDLWVTETRTKETKILAKLSGTPSGIELSKDGKSIFVTNKGSIVKIDDAGKSTPIAISGEMVLNQEQERKYIFEHCWRQVVKKFYDPKLHGVDWKMYKDAYARFLPHISNNYDYQEFLSELLGELNASHTGGRYSPSFSNPDVTASLGLLYDETAMGNGLKVTEVLAGGPFDRKDTRMKAGAIIEKIDGQVVDNSQDWSKFLNRKVSANTLISFRVSKDSAVIEEVVKPINPAVEAALMYNRWLEIMRQKTEQLSGGKLGYVHVQGMNDGSFRQVYDEVMGKNFEMKALIVDTRFNGGGWLHDDLVTFLGGKRYLDFAPQGHRLKDGEALGKWTKPSCVLMCEGNYSDAFIFPYVYKQNGLGKVIGMPVPGTGTAVWWETQIDPTLVFGIPMVATIGKENRPSENLQLEADIMVPLNYEDFMNGKDTQLEAAVKHLLSEVKN